MVGLDQSLCEGFQQGLERKRDARLHKMKETGARWRCVQKTTGCKLLWFVPLI